MPDASTQRLKVFLCHSSGDKPIVRELYHQLKAEGWIDPWLDEMKLLPGQEWDIEIEKAVEAADIVLVCLSNHSVDKEGYVQKELRFVLNLADEKPEGSIFVIPLRLDGCVVPRRLRHWQWVDYFPESQRLFAYTRLLESFKVRAKKLGISYQKPMVELTQKAHDKMLMNVSQDKPVSFAKRSKQQKSEGQPEDKPEIKKVSHPKFVADTLTPRSAPVLRINLPWKPVVVIAWALVLVALLVWGGTSLWKNLSSSTPEPTRISLPTATKTVKPVITNTPSSTKTSVPTSPTLGIGSTMTGTDGMTLLYVPAGEFTMGSEDGDDNEKPVHKVNIDAFWIDQTEVTNIMFIRFIDETRYTTDAENAFKSYVYKNDSWQYVNGADWAHPLGPSSDVSDIMSHPVVHVSWNDAQEYCSWADRRLPTEAEWEKAASWDVKNRQKYVYPWGNEFDGNLSNFCDKNCSFNWADKKIDDGYEFTAPVGTYPIGASPYGVLDMAGNVWEWVSSRYQDYPYSALEDLSVGIFNRVLRGGAWPNLDYSLRSTYRDWINPSSANFSIGFRCAMDAD